MMNKVLTIVFLGLFFISIHFLEAAESLSSFQERTEKTFLSEAANKNTFKKALQTARLLGYLEFVQPHAFVRFHNCLSTDKKWDYLSAKKRQTLLNSCKAQGRSLSGSTPFAVSSGLSVRPAANQKQEIELKQLRKEIYDLRNMVEKLSEQIKNNHDRTLQSLQNLSQVPESSSAVEGSDNF